LPIGAGSQRAPSDNLCSCTSARLSSRWPVEPSGTTVLSSRLAFSSVLADIVIEVVIALVTGAGLFFALPRGVVLTRSPRTQDFNGQGLYDTWEIRNDSALPVRIMSVTYAGPDTWNETTGRIEQLELPTFEGEGKLGVSLAFDDEVLEITRFDSGKRWRELVVPPGDTMRAHVVNNRTLTIRYRRDGFFGRLERRVITVDGGV
jgi:hypothetical protein